MFRIISLILNLIKILVIIFLIILMAKYIPDAIKGIKYLIWELSNLIKSFN